MNFFSKNKIERVINVVVIKVYHRVDNGDWHLPSGKWSKVVLVSAKNELLSINYYWPILKDKTQIEVALKEVIAYYVFHTIDLGYGDFLKTNNLTKEEFVDDICNIFDLTINNKKHVNKYIEKYGSEVTDKYFRAPKITKEMSEEFSRLIDKKIRDYLNNIAHSVKIINDIGLPNDKVIESIATKRTSNLIIFNELMNKYGLISNPV